MVQVVASFTVCNKVKDILIIINKQPLQRKYSSARIYKQIFIIFVMLE